jgi:hypothetical protein
MNLTPFRSHPSSSRLRRAPVLSNVEGLRANGLIWIFCATPKLQTYYVAASTQR